MKFIITGATSFIGLELIDELLKHGHSVVAVCRPHSRGLSNIPSAVTIVEAEMSGYSRLDALVSSADVFINLAWGGTGHDGRDIVDIQNDNIRYTIDAIYSAKRMGCKLFVEAGSQAEYGSTTKPQTEDGECNPFSEYGKAKLKVRNVGFELSQTIGIKYLHLRIFSVFGENDHPWTLIMGTLDKMLVNKQIDLSSCTQNWNFVYVRDAVQIMMNLCVRALNNPDFRHEVYNIASRDTRNLKDFVGRMKLLSHSNSVLNYGAYMPANLVSLQPDITKTVNDSGYDDFHHFDYVINSIIREKLNTKAVKYD